MRLKICIAGWKTVAALVMCAYPMTASAILVTDNGATVFWDGYEQDTLGTTPTTALVGTYSNPQGIAIVQNANPTAYQGTQYLHMVRPAELLMQAELTAAVNIGRTLHMDLALYADTATGSDSPVNMQLRNPSAGIEFAFLSVPTGTVSLFDPAFGVLTGTVPWVANQWQVWSIDYVVGSGALTLTIDGNSQTFGVHQSGSNPIDRVIFTGRTGSNDVYNIDSVLPIPEPNAIASVLLGFSCGMAFLLKRRRRLIK